MTPAKRYNTAGKEEERKIVEGKTRRGEWPACVENRCGG